ncbi:acetyltransferase [Vibrio cholerae]|nr:acetyltransferase [Vibrio cholerae]
MEPRRLRLLCLSLVVVRYQPLRRALALSEEYYEICGFSDRCSVDFI